MLPRETVSQKASSATLFKSCMLLNRKMRWWVIIIVSYFAMAERIDIFVMSNTFKSVQDDSLLNGAGRGGGRDRWPSPLTLPSPSGFLLLKTLGRQASGAVLGDLLCGSRLWMPSPWQIPTALVKSVHRTPLSTWGLLPLLCQHGEPLCHALCQLCDFWNNLHHICKHGSVCTYICL